MSEQNVVEDKQFSQFIAAIKNGSLEEVEDLLRSGPPGMVNRIESQFRQPSLYFAALTGRDELSAELIKLLVRNGANVGFKDHNEQSILFYICRQGKQKCAQLLLSHGLSLDDLDVYGQTPLFYAVSQNRIDIVSKYATKERVNHVDKLARQTPLYYAARRGHLDMASLLLSRGADIGFLDANNKTAVEYARKAKFYELGDFLNAELKRVKEVSKSEEPQKKSIPRRKDETVKEARHSYKLVHLNEKGETRDLTEEEVKQIVAGRPELASYFANPQSIPQDSDEDSWDKAALRVLNQCCKAKGAFYFLEPVDTVKFDIMDYFDIITHPMDLGTVRKRLAHNFYSNPRLFVQDMNLIWNNCMKYNGPQHIISKYAQELKDYFNQQLSAQGLDKYLSSPQPQGEVSEEIFQEVNREIVAVEAGEEPERDDFVRVESNDGFREQLDESRRDRNLEEGNDGLKGDGSEEPKGDASEELKEDGSGQMNEEDEFD